MFTIDVGRGNERSADAPTRISRARAHATVPDMESCIENFGLREPWRRADDSPGGPDFLPPPFPDSVVRFRRFFLC